MTDGYFIPQPEAQFHKHLHYESEHYDDNGHVTRNRETVEKIILNMF